MDNNAKLIEIFKRITTDFSFFFEHITISCRDFSLPPEKDLVTKRPLKLAKHQKELIEYIETCDKPEKIILKSRQIGVTTVLIAYILWRMMYGYDQNIIYLLDLDIKTDKMRLLLQEMYHSIPEFLRTELDFKATVTSNAKNNNYLYIQTSSAKYLRSAAYTLGIFDEYAFYEIKDQEAIDQAAIASCPNRICLSTPRIQNDIFEAKCKRAEKEGYIYKRTIWDVTEWYGGLDNARAWFNRGTENQSQAYINREYLCEFKGAAEDTVFEREDYMFEDWENTGESAMVTLDLGYKDSTAILFAAITENGLHFMDEEVVDHHNIYEIIDIILKRGYSLNFGVADSNGKSTDITSGVSAWKELKEYIGIPFYTRKPKKMTMKQIVQSALYKKIVKIDRYRCPKLVDMIYNYEWSKTGKFVHNDYSHIYDSFVYGVLNWILIHNRGRKPSIRMVDKYANW